MTAGTGHSRFAVVEDEPFMGALIQDMLAMQGREVALFERGLDLLTCPDLLQFQAILLDLSLPDIDGFDLMEKLAPLVPATPILLMSGHSRATVRAAELYAKGIGLSVCGYLCKPFSRGDLYLALGIA